MVALRVEDDYFGAGQVHSVANGYTRLCAAVIGQALVDNDLNGLDIWVDLMGGDITALHFLTPRQRYAAGYALLKAVGSAAKRNNRGILRGD